jgi:hypothetical protein
MAYLKSANAAWQARPGFSGLGAMRRRRGLRGFGAVPTTFATAIPGFAPTVVFGSRSLGPIAAPIWQQSRIGTVLPGITPAQTASIAAQQSTTNTGAGSTAANVSGSPVPVGYPTNSIYVDSNGGFWEYSSAQGTWLNVGTPYNVGGTATSAPSTTASTTASGAVVPYSPVPAGYPTNMLYTYTDGSVWQYNASIGGWTEIQAPSTTTSMLTSSGVPTGTPTTAPYTDSAGNVWTYNPTTGQWAISVPASSSGYQSILDWLSTSTLISGVPNWIIAAGAGFAAIKLMNPSRGR